ncbi:MAG: DUF3426 domain-containing protein [Kiloniellales bacterium]
MNLICPSCRAKFLVEPDQLGPNGRRVRCGDCAHTWFQEPLAEETPAEETPASAPSPQPESAEIDYSHSEPAAEAPAAPEPPLEDLTEEETAVPDIPEADPGLMEPIPEGLGAPGLRSRRAYRRPPSPPVEQRSSLLLGWLLLLVVVAGLSGGFYFGREQIVEAAPGAVRLYALLGLPVKDVGEGLELRDVKSVRRLVDGKSVIIIEGLVANVSEKDQQVPLMRASLLDSDGEELDQWIFSAQAETLPPGGTTAFETSMQNPPRAGNLSIDFVAPD